MLLRVLFVLALISLLAETVVHGASALATVTLHHRATAIARTQYAAALASAQASIAQSIAANGVTAPITVVPAAPACVLSGNSGCALLAQSSIALATPAPPAAQTCPQTNCVVYMQANDAVDEGVVTVHVVTSVRAPDGTVLAAHTGDAAFRTFATAPYASLAGSTDASVNDVASGRTGYDGGTSGPGDTLVRVEYVNAANPNASPIPGNVWHAQTQNPATAAGSWER